MSNNRAAAVAQLIIVKPCACVTALLYDEQTQPAVGHYSTLRTYQSLAGFLCSPGCRVPAGTPIARLDQIPGGGRDFDLAGPMPAAELPEATISPVVKPHAAYSGQHWRSLGASRRCPSTST